jgi:hypothetical protein
MSRNARLTAVGLAAEMAVADYLDPEGNIAIPDGVTLTSYLDRNIAALGETPSYRYLDYEHDGAAIELTWTQLGTRLRRPSSRPTAWPRQPCS